MRKTGQSQAIVKRSPRPFIRSARHQEGDGGDDLGWRRLSVGVEGGPKAPPGGGGVASRGLKRPRVMAALQAGASMPWVWLEATAAHAVARPCALTSIRTTTRPWM